MQSTINKQRLPEIDLLRGIALLGILLINVQVFSTTFFLWAKWFDKFNSVADYYVFRSVNLFVCQRFIGIFSFLFGLGIAMQRHRFKESDKPFTRYYFRRTGVLALLGIINITLFFWGDILFIYSMLSVLLFFFFRASNKTLLIAACLVFFIPVALYCLPQVAAAMEQNNTALSRYYSEDGFIKIYRSGSFTQMVRARVYDYCITYLPDVIWHRTSFTMMLLGFYAGRNNLHNTWRQYEKQIKIFLAVALPYCIVYAAGDYRYNYFFSREVVFIWLNNLFIAASVLSYILLALMIYKGGLFQTVTNWFVNIGKLSLSNYFFQQVACAFIFHNYGLGLYFTTGPIANILIAVGIFALQLILSNLYLKRYGTGPLEWVWRKLSY